MAVGVRLRSLEWDAVLPKKIDNHVRERLAFFDRHQKDVVTAVGTFLGQNADVGNENETRITDPDRLLLDWVPTVRGQEKEAAFASAIGRFAKMFGEIERGVIRFPFVLHRDALPFGRDAGDVFVVEVIRVLKKRIFKFSFGLTDEVIDLGCCDPANLEFDRAQCARTDRQFLLAIDGQDAALAFDLQFARQRWHVDDRVVIFAQRIIAKRANAFFYSNVKLAVGFNADTKGVLSILHFLRRKRHKSDWA